MIHDCLCEENKIAYETALMYEIKHKTFIILFIDSILEIILIQEKSHNMLEVETKEHRSSSTSLAKPKISIAY